MESFKIYFGANSDNIRRVSLPKDNFSEVIKQLHALYSGDENLYHGELRIQYIDNEGDKITVSSQGEWEEMTEAAGTARPIKLWIVEGMNPSGYFKDGPAPEPVSLLVDGQTNVPITGQVAETVSIVVDCLSNLFPGGKILPYNLPTWLKESGAITLKPVHNAQQPTEDFIVDLHKLVQAMGREALLRIRPDSTNDQLNEAKVFLQTILSIEPDDTLSYYNLACANALLGSADAAIIFLEKAYEKGYSNVEHMERDSDLVSLRDRQEYKDLVRRMKGQESPAAVCCHKEPEPVVEQQKEQPVVVVEEQKKEEVAPVVEVKEQSLYSEMVPFLLVLGVPESQAVQLLTKHNGNVELAADDYYSGLNGSEVASFSF